MCEIYFSYSTGKASKPSGKSGGLRKTVSPKKAEVSSSRKPVSKTSSLDSHLESEHAALSTVEKQISEPAVKMVRLGSQ